MKRIINTNGIYSIIDEDRTEMPSIVVYARSVAGRIHTATLQELVECVYHGFRNLRYDVRIETDPRKLSGNVILIGGFGLTKEEIDLLPPTAITYNTEHTSSRYLCDPSHPYRSLMMKFPVWDFSSDNARRIRETLHIDAQFVPLGYVPELTRVPRSNADIDVLFYGSHNERRNAVINKMRALGLSVHHAFGVYGSDRDALIARSKVIINIHQLLPGAFEILRIAYCLANAKAVVTECNAGETIDADLAEALFPAAYEELADACLCLVKDDKRRQALEDAALTTFSRRCEPVILRNAIASLADYFPTVEPTGVQKRSGGNKAKVENAMSNYSTWSEHPRLINRYLNLLESTLVGSLYGDQPIDPWHGGKYDPNVRALGRDWPGLAQTMIGTVRMRNLRHLCETTILDGTPGDFVETGVWRGGACIYMRGILEAYGDATRRVFVADSFKGLPPPNPTEYPADTGDQHHTRTQLAVSRSDVEENFRRYGLLDDRVIFLEGWFKDTLSTAPIDKIAVLRLDGDMYEATIQVLDSLYHKVSPGGFVIVDDYNLRPSAQAVNDFRTKHGVHSPLIPIDGWAVWWRVSV